MGYRTNIMVTSTQEMQGGRALQHPAPIAVGLWATRTGRAGRSRTCTPSQRAQSLTSGHTDPRICIACRAEWPEKSRSPHVVELVRMLPMPQLGRGG